MNALRASATGTLRVVAMAPLCMLANSALTGLTVTCVAASTLVLSQRLSALVAARLPSLHAWSTGIMVAAAWVSVLDLVLQWLAPELRVALGPYAPFIAGTYALLPGRREEGETATERGGEPLGAVLLLPLSTGTVREVLGAGRLLGDLDMITHDPSTGWVLFAHAPLPVFALAPGTFLVLAILLMAWPFESRSQDKNNAN
ncbi:MAG: Rnf-Nqr domain containing protein [Pseudomonadota bacterium]